MKNLLGKLVRPLDKLLYRPISTQNERNQAQRADALTARRATTDVRPEKRNGALRHR
jgi:hypothetical protein